MDQPFCSKWSFYKGQKVLCAVVNIYAEDSMKKARSNISPGIIVYGDGRYPLRRNSWHCSFDIIDISTNKILALGIVDKKSKFHPDETFDGTSNLLESEAMARAIKQLNDIKNRISGFVIDGDNKNRNILENEHFNIYIETQTISFYPLVDI